MQESAHNNILEDDTLIYFFFVEIMGITMDVNKGENLFLQLFQWNTWHHLIRIQHCYI
jgi:hypothetical protein